MAFTFETSGNNTFLVYAVQEEDILDTMTLGMITNNRIPGMAPVLYTQMNQDGFLKYNVTAKVTVRQFFSGIVNKRRLLGVFSSVASALAVAEEYMIDCNTLLLDTNYIYADVSTCKAEVICLPVVRESEVMDTGLFFKNIMFSTQFDQTENCDYVARIINCLNSMPVFVAEDFLHLLEELQEAGGTSVPHGVQSQPVFMPQDHVSGQSASAPQTKITAQTKQSVSAAQAIVPTQSRQSAPASGKPGDSAAVGMGFAVPGQVGDGIFDVPGQDSAGKTTGAECQNAEEKCKEKEMSMLYLLQHYNKENAAIYKAQKEAKKKGGKASPAAKAASAPASGFAVPGQQLPTVQSQIQPKVQQPIVQPQQPPVQSIPANDNFGDTVVMGAEGYGEDTVVIGGTLSAPAAKPYLRRSSNNEKILLDKPIFHIGKERSYVDYCISGNATISRSHADIIDRNGQFFIVDNNSTNHTYVNGEMISSNTEIPLSHGTKIRLSDEEFEFLIF